MVLGALLVSVPSKHEPHCSKREKAVLADAMAHQLAFTSIVLAGVALLLFEPHYRNIFDMRAKPLVDKERA